MRISDWSSDVCSSDLQVCRGGRFVAKAYRILTLSLYQLTDAGNSLSYATEQAVSSFNSWRCGLIEAVPSHSIPSGQGKKHMMNGTSTVKEAGTAKRTEERRVGKGVVRTCRSRWWADH